MTKTNFNLDINLFFNDCKSKCKLSVNIWFLLLSYLSLWDIFPLRLVSKQNFVVVSKYLSFSKQIISTSLSDNFVNQRIKILYKKTVDSFPHFDQSFYLHVSYILSCFKQRITIFDCLSHVLFSKRLKWFPFWLFLMF